MQGWKEADYRSPELKERTQPDKVELKLPLVNLLSADITKLLKALCDKGFLTSYGFGRGTKYQINDEYELSSLQNDDSNFKNDDSNLKNDDSIRKKKASQKLIDSILVACEEYTSVEEIAIKVGKSISHLKNRVLPRMIEDQLLERLFPDVLKHPRQKYRAKKIISDAIIIFMQYLMMIVMMQVMVIVKV